MTNRLLNVLLLLACVAFSPGRVSAATAPAAQSGEPGSELSIYLLTMSPGQAVYERFGHNALWVHDASLDPRDPRADLAFNWGMFSFEEENFVWRFIHGRLDYWMEPIPMWNSAGGRYKGMYQIYREDGRAIWAQELNLSPAQRLAFRDFIYQNARPENRQYKYDYYRDNCSTRVRDAIDRITGGQMKAQLSAEPVDATYRSHTLRLTADSVWWFSALDFLLGHRADQPLSAWEECFLPMKLREHLATVTILDDQGNPQPLVKPFTPKGSSQPQFERQLSFSTRPPLPEVRPDRTWQYLAAGLGLGALMLLSARLAPRHRLARVGFILVALFWTLLAALGGVIAAYAWFLTDHAAAYRNENLLQLNPLAWPLVVLAPLLALRARAGAKRTHRRTVLLARGFALAVFALSLIGLVAKLLPAMYQANHEIIALALPSHLGLLGAVFWSSRRVQTSGPGKVEDHGVRAEPINAEQVVVSAGRKRVKSVAR